uniref:Uncharacterized protein n=1 Tax=Candidatus Kentrum sp. DK TaxID=2126562 RepID=A0A450S7U7_9GAMM|nr:MAG: hypothetical protein BECKDK2373B_GA0170837_101929 [Candidatus Kentron sp. DK]
MLFMDKYHRVENVEIKNGFLSLIVDGKKRSAKPGTSSHVPLQAGAMVDTSRRIRDFSEASPRKPNSCSTS